MKDQTSILNVSIANTTKQVGMRSDIATTPYDIYVGYDVDPSNITNELAVKIGKLRSQVVIFLTGKVDDVEDYNCIKDINCDRIHSPIYIGNMDGDKDLVARAILDASIGEGKYTIKHIKEIQIND